MGKKKQEKLESGTIFVDGHDENGDRFGYMIVPLSLAPIAPDEVGILRPTNGYEWGDFELIEPLTDKEIEDFCRQHNKFWRRLIWDIDNEMRAAHDE